MIYYPILTPIRTRCETSVANSVSLVERALVKKRSLRCSYASPESSWGPLQQAQADRDNSCGYLNEWRSKL
jgi:hypothetical protein